MKVVVSTHAWLPVGGGRFVMAKAVETFLNANCDVSIASTFRFDKQEFFKLYNVDLSKVKHYSLPIGMPKLFGIYQRLISSIPLSKAIKKERPDVIFTDNELFKPILKLKEKYDFKLVEYIHFPFKLIQLIYSPYYKTIGWFSEDVKTAADIYIRDTELYHKKYEKGLWKLYFKVWLKFYERVARDSPFDSDDLVIVNSKYIARLVKLLWNYKPKVIHPPVKIHDFLQHANKQFNERNNAVAMLARITPEKRFETVIEAIAASNSKPTLRIIGGVIVSSYPYLEKLRKLCEKKDVNAEFHINVPRSEVVKLLTSSKVFVHACIGEHFGIAVVEGMAAGLPVLVHKSGGPYEDITDYGKYGKCYETVEELAKEIDDFISNPEKWKTYHQLSLDRAPLFSEKEFSKKLLNAVKTI